MKSKHQNEFCEFTQILEDVKLSKEKRKRETDCEVIPASVFSTASEILNKRRNRLLPNNAEQLLFVHENIANVNYQW